MVSRRVPPWVMERGWCMMNLSDKLRTLYRGSRIGEMHAITKLKQTEMLAADCDSTEEDSEDEE